MMTESGQSQSPGYGGYSTQAHINPLDTLRILSRYRRDIFVVFILVALAAVAAVFVISPKYRGVTTLLIEPKTAKVVDIDEVYAPENQSREYMKTQAEVLQSRELAAKVVDKLNLTRHQAFLEVAQGKGNQIEEYVQKLLLALSLNPPIDQSPEAQRQRVIDQFVGDTVIVPAPNTNLVRIGFQSRNAELSAEGANALAEAYVGSQIGARLEASEKATIWLTARIEDVRQKLQESEKALQQYLESEQLLNVGGGRGLVEEELSDSNRRMRDARRIKTELESVYRKVVQAGTNIAELQEIPVIAQEALVQTTKRSVLDAQAVMQGLESQYGPKHPRMIAARASLKEAQDAQAKQVLLAAQGLRSQYEAALATERSLNSIVESSKTQIRGLDRKKYDLQVLEREVEANRELYDTFLTRFKEATQVGKLELDNARVVDKAVVPNKPFKPRKMLIIGAGLVAGLLLGMLVAFLRHFLNDSIQSAETLEENSGLPVLAILPLVKNGLFSDKRISRIEIDDPKSAFAEGIRTIRTNILLSEIDNKRTRILVTSSVPEEGKTTMLVNLGVALGSSERVLLIDADLRRPSVSEKLGLKKDLPGLSQLIAGQISIEQALQRFEAGNLDVLTAGLAPPNPSEMLSSRRFAVLLDALSERYDRILIDSPPCQAVSDALLLAGRVDGVLLLAKFESTRRRLIQDTVRQLQRAKAPLIGAVLNYFDADKAFPYDSGYYYYENYYRA